MVADGRGSIVHRTIVAALAALLLVACQPGPVYRPASSPVAAEPAPDSPALVPEATGLEGDATVSGESSERESPEDASEADRADEPAGLTNHQLDGNRVVNGYSDLSTISPIDVELLGVPAWVASVSVGQDETGEDVADPQGVAWGVVLEDGRTQAFLVGGGEVTPVPTQPERLPVGMPPLMEYVDGTAQFVIPSGDMSTLTNAVQVGDALIGVEEDGDLRIEEGEETTILDADALPDARVLADDAGQVLFVSSPTERYAHGVLGDGLEAAGITLAEIEPEPRIVRTFEIPEPLVLEGIAPIWADLDGDGVREILATLSDAIEGARVVVYAEDGSVIAEGPAVGQGNRWRHQIAVAPFGPQGELELAVVLTPHIGGVVEFYALRDGRLEVVAEMPGFTSHVLGSRNLDMAVAASPAGDGQAVLLAPSQDRSRLGAIRHGETGAETVWMVDVDGLMVTNLAAASLDSDEIGVCVGRSDGILRIWQPD